MNPQDQRYYNRAAHDDSSQNQQLPSPPLILHVAVDSAPPQFGNSQNKQEPKGKRTRSQQQIPQAVAGLTVKARHRFPEVSANDSNLDALLAQWNKGRGDLLEARSQPVQLRLRPWQACRESPRSRHWRFRRLD